MVLILLKIEDSGSHVLEFAYRVRINELSHETIPSSFMKIFTITYTCLYPIVQVFKISKT